jgi:tRNA(fMet)-specific endonuclease VapC
MIELMLDANICIRVMRNRPPEILARLEAEAGRMAVSVIVHHELEYGVRRADDPEKQAALLDKFLSLIVVIDFDEAASVHAADIKADLASRGNMIGPNDVLIAGHARSLGVKLITGNLKEFSRVEGLRCEDWL